jgi:hypothetical protein
MMVGMDKAEGHGPDVLGDGRQDVEVTGTLPIFMTTFVGRDQELDEIRSLFREGKRLVTLVGIDEVGLSLVLNVRARRAPRVPAPIPLAGNRRAAGPGAG